MLTMEVGKRYTLGRHLAELARSSYDDHLLRTTEAAVRGVLHDSGCSTVWLAGGTPAAVTAVYRLSQSHPHWVQRPGQRLHPYANVCSATFQAYWSVSSRELFRSAYPFSTYGATIWGSVDALDDALTRFRAAGYGFLESRHGGYSAGVPLFDSGGDIVGVVGAQFEPGTAGTAAMGSGLDGLISALRGHSARVQNALAATSAFGLPWEGQLHRPVAQAPVLGPDGRRPEPPDM
jgi:DNA-binding IclR family transcriptional regulator